MGKKGQPAECTRRNGTEARRKTIFLTDAGREKIQRFADEQHISFSSAIEALALFGLDEPAAVALAPMVASIVHHGVEQQFGRLARLIAFTAIETGIAARMSTASMFWHVYQLAGESDDDALSQLLFSPDPDSDVEQRTRGLIKRLKDRARIDSVVQLRHRLDLTGLLAPESTSSAE